MRGRRKVKSKKTNPEKSHDLIKPSFLGESATIISAESSVVRRSDRLPSPSSLASRKSTKTTTHATTDAKLTEPSSSSSSSRQGRHARFRAIWIPRILSGTQFIAFFVIRSKDTKVVVFLHFLQNVSDILDFLSCRTNLERRKM